MYLTFKTSYIPITGPTMTMLNKIFILQGGALHLN